MVASTLTFDEQALVSIKLPRERTLIVPKALFWPEEPAEIRGVQRCTWCKVLSFFIAEGKPVREFRAALLHRRRLLFCCNLGKVGLEGVLPEAWGKSFLL
jgi:hypothetical protein